MISPDSYRDQCSILKLLSRKLKDAVSDTTEVE